METSGALPALLCVHGAGRFAVPNLGMKTLADASFLGVPKWRFISAKTLPTFLQGNHCNLQDKTHFSCLGNHFPILRNHFPNLGNHFLNMRKPFPILRNHFLNMGNHFSILRNPSAILRNHFLCLGNGFFDAKCPAATWKPAHCQKFRKYAGWKLDKIRNEWNVKAINEKGMRGCLSQWNKS